MSALIERVTLKNYKSVVDCSVSLRPLTVIVGRNGSGKSNFLDSLHFIADSLTSSLEFAIRTRGGIKAIAHQAGRGSLAIEVLFRTASGHSATYSVVLKRAVVAAEHLSIETEGRTVASFAREGIGGEIIVEGVSLPAPPSVLGDRLALVALSGTEVFREAFDALASMRFYRLNPDAMRDVQEPDEGDALRADGSNIASVWGRLQRSNRSVAQRLTSFLEAVVPGIANIRRTSLGLKETLDFEQIIEGGKRLSFEASSMSDGTLRALGALVASRPMNGSRTPTLLVAIEEPETALHPAAIAALMDALHEASLKTQVMVTSHSADVVDQVDLSKDALLVTSFERGATTIGEASDASREAIRRHLYTAGELLRMDQLLPAAAATGAE